MARQLDHRLHAMGGADVLVFNDAGDGWLSIVIQQPSGVGVEALLSSAQAAQLAEVLLREVERG